MAATNAKSFSHWIFGYGSLICPTSRAVTAPSLQGRRATPVLVHHLERIWSFPVPECGQTFMGIRRRPHAKAVGVLVPVSEEELAKFDIRELGYERVSIAHQDIERIPFLLDESKGEGVPGGCQNHGSSTNLNVHYGSTGDHVCYFEQITPSSSTENQQPSPPLITQNINVWVYIQEAPAPICHEAPIAQTYLDVILRGCLSISKQFAHQFILTTRGWSVDDFDRTTAALARQNFSADSEEDQKEGSLTLQMGTYWVDDRKKPIYVRADPDFSNKFGHELDALLKGLRPREMAHRRLLGNSDGSIS